MEHSNHNNLEGFLYIIGCVFLSLIAVEDVKKMEISNWYNGALLFVGAAKLLFNKNWEQQIIVTLIILIFLLISAFLSRGGLGGGDVKLVSASTLIFGFQIVCGALIIGAIAVTITGIVSWIMYNYKDLKIKKKQKRLNFGKMEFPFGPYFILGVLMIFWKVI